MSFRGLLLVVTYMILLSLVSLFKLLVLFVQSLKTFTYSRKIYYLWWMNECISLKLYFMFNIIMNAFHRHINCISKNWEGLIHDFTRLQISWELRCYRGAPPLAPASRGPPPQLSGWDTWGPRGSGSPWPCPATPCSSPARACCRGKTLSYPPHRRSVPRETRPDPHTEIKIEWWY